MSKTFEADAGMRSLQLDFFEAGHLRRATGGWVHVKTAPYTIVAQATAGSYELRRDGRSELIGKGRALVVPAHTEAEFVHRAGPGGVMEARWLHLRFSLHGLVDFMGRHELPLQLTGGRSREAGGLIARALAAAKRPPDDPVRLMTEQEIAGRMLALVCGGAPLKPGPGPTAERFGAVLAHIRENLAAPLDANALARRAGLSPARFHAVFRREFGVTPMRYVRTVRLEAAARLMVAGGVKLARIAEATGFADAFHLSHAFKAHFGASPRAYRERAARV